MKNQKGITLIALVITIIVMLILVGVSVTVALNGGLFSTAQQAKENTATERDKELNLSDGKVEINGEWYNSIDEYVNGGTSNEPTEYTAYSIGDEVIVEGENFYVIEESGSSESTVTLLAKYNLNTAGTAQLNASSSETKCVFSSTNYWSSETEYPLNLNDYTVPEDATSIITTAKTYGESKGGTGRLLTKEEATELKETHEGIISGTNIGATDGSLYYWLATASDSDSVNVITGIGDYNSAFGHGVRPVIEVSKDLVSLAS